MSIDFIYIYNTVDKNTYLLLLISFSNTPLTRTMQNAKSTRYNQPQYNIVSCGIIVCYERLVPKSEYREQDKGSSDDYDKVSFYMHQSKVLDNACGIIACLHAVFNSPVVSVDPTSVLGKYRQSTESCTPTEKCEALEKNTEFQKIHKANAAKGQSRAITSDQSKVKHHFIAYVLDKDGKKLVELDGTKAGPVIVKEDCNGDLLRGSIREIKGKLERGEISESLSMMTLNLSQE